MTQLRFLLNTAGHLGIAHGGQRPVFEEEYLGDHYLQLLGWKQDKVVKKLKPRFVLLLGVLALARKSPERLQKLTMRPSDDGAVPLAEVRRLASFGRAATLEGMRHSITNYLHTALDRPGCIKLVPTGQPRGSEAGLYLLIAPEHITLMPEAEQALLDWVGRELTTSASGDSNEELLGTDAPLADGAEPSSPPAPSSATPTPAPPHRFVGREGELQTLLRYFSREPLESVALYGPRCAGKTALLRELERRCRDTPELLPAAQIIRVDLDDPRLRGPLPLLQALERRLGLPEGAGADIDLFIEAIEERAESPGSPRTAILLDHCDHAFVSDRFDELFFSGLRYLVTNGASRRFAVVLASKRSPTELIAEERRSSPLLGALRALQLGPLPEPDARAYLASVPIPLDEADAEWLLSASARWPRLLRIGCDHLLAARGRGDDGDGWKGPALAEIEPLRPPD